MSAIKIDKIGNDIPMQIRYFISLCKYRKAISNAIKFESTEKLIDLIFSNFDHILSPLQVRSEISDLIYILSDLQLNNVMEIGSANGGTAVLFSKISMNTAKIICLDLPFGIFKKTFSLMRSFLFKAFLTKSQSLFLVEKNSTYISTRDEILRILNGDLLDLLFIDGDHSYKGVKNDFELYSPIIKDGGIICFHDIVHHPAGTVSHPTEVDRFWNEIKKDYDYIELIENPYQGWGGIGVIRKGSKPSNIYSKIILKDCHKEQLYGISITNFEDEYAWTEDHTAKIVIHLKEKINAPELLLDIKAIPFAPAAIGNDQYVDVYINNNKITRWALTEKKRSSYKAMFSSSLIIHSSIEIMLSFSKRVCPYELGISSDMRLLGLAIFEIEIKETSFAKIYLGT